jgi:hypothetical protein
MMFTVAGARKALVAVVAVAGEAVALGLLHGTAQNVALLIIAGGGALGVYAVPNKPKPT